MTWGIVASSAASLIGGYMANKSSGNASSAIQAGNQQAIDFMKQMYGQGTANFQPYLDAGTWGLGKEQAYLNGDYSGFLNSPDYKAALAQGQNAIDSSAAARGGLFGGGHTRDSIAFGSGLAEQYGNNYYGKLAGLSQQGLGAAQGIGQLDAGLAQGVGNLYSANGQAQASAYQQQGANNSSMIGSLGNGFGSLLGSYMGAGG